MQVHFACRWHGAYASLTDLMSGDWCSHKVHHSVVVPRTERLKGQRFLRAKAIAEQKSKLRALNPDQRRRVLQSQERPCVILVAILVVQICMPFL